MSLRFEDTPGTTYTLRLAFDNSIRAKFDANDVVCGDWKTFVTADVSLRNVVLRLTKTGRGREWRKVFAIKEEGDNVIREEILFMTFKNVDQVLSLSRSDAWVGYNLNYFHAPLTFHLLKDKSTRNFRYRT